jgi:hypothetical protein
MDTEIGRSRHRHVLVPFTSSKDADGNWTHTATDISGEDAQCASNSKCCVD